MDTGEPIRIEQTSAKIISKINGSRRAYVILFD
jgi:hypothetical protein